LLFLFLASKREGGGLNMNQKSFKKSSRSFLPTFCTRVLFVGATLLTSVLGGTGSTRAEGYSVYTAAYGKVEQLNDSSVTLTCFSSVVPSYYSGNLVCGGTLILKVDGNPPAILIQPAGAYGLTISFGKKIKLAKPNS
jgi:hypothetical protein